MKKDGTETEHFFGPDGFFAKHLETYEPRRQQERLASEVDDFLNSKDSVFFAEAPTGVGKTFALLAPSLMWAIKNDKKILYLTKSLTLQTQLMKKDLAFFAHHLGFEMKCALLKGRQNYVCRRLVEEEKGHHGNLDFGDGGWATAHIQEWMDQTLTGDMAELKLGEHHKARRAFASDWKRCLGKHCSYYDQCFYYATLRDATFADLVVSNYHHFLTYRAKGQLFPFDFDLCICDEAHQLVSAYRSVAGEHVRWDEAKKLLGHPPTKMMSHRAQELVQRCYDQLDELKDQFVSSQNWPVGVGDRFALSFAGEIKPFGADFMSDATTLVGELGKVVTLCTAAEADEPIEAELLEWVRHLQGIKTGLESCLCSWRYPHWTYQCDSAGNVEVQPVTCETFIPPLFLGNGEAREDKDSNFKLIAVSATLSVDQSFDFFINESGLVPDRTLIVDSPFDLKNQMEIWVVDVGVDNTDVSYPYRVAAVAREYAVRNRGHCLVLLSKRETQEKVLRKFESLSEKGFEVLCSATLGEEQMIKRFVDAQGEKKILVGMDKLKEGLDLPGDQLTLVMIDRIPFDPPSSPVCQAKQVLLGKRCFGEYNLPLAKMKLKQAVGRLIRTSKDKGVVAILDPRILQRKNWKIESVFEPAPMSRIKVNFHDR